MICRNNVIPKAAIVLVWLAGIGVVRGQSSQPTIAGNWVLDPVATGVANSAPRPVDVEPLSPVAHPRKLKDARPMYPPMAQSVGKTGVVVAEAVIGKNGKVSELRVIRSIPMLDRAALIALSQWQYEPTIVNGTQVEVVTALFVTFLMDDVEPSPNVRRLSLYSQGGFLSDRIRIKQERSSLTVTRIFEDYEETSAYRLDGLEVKNRLLRTGTSTDGTYGYVSRVDGMHVVTTISWRSADGPRERRETISIAEEVLTIQLGPPTGQGAAPDTAKTYIYKRVS